MISFHYIHAKFTLIQFIQKWLGWVHRLPQNKLQWTRSSEKQAAHTQQKLTQVYPRVLNKMLLLENPAEIHLGFYKLNLKVKETFGQW